MRHISSGLVLFKERRIDLENENKSLMKKVTDKLFAGLDMSWLTVILMAVISAIITAVFLQVPIFKDTSFERMGIDLEAWILLAVFIMPNCKKPLESAVKTFVFFLISQPLIYLIQVPFSDMGWRLFGFYKTWFIWTLFTFPMAFVGWYIKKRNWLSTLIIAPVIVFLTAVGAGALCDTFYDPPFLLVTGIFCLAQVAVYIFAFTGNMRQRLALCAVAVVTAVIAVIMASKVSFSGESVLPEGHVYSESATVEVEDSSVADISLSNPEEGFVYVNGKKIGTTTFTVIDGDKANTYTLKIYIEKGHLQLKITEKE